MYTVGLTGGIGSGKSTVAGVFRVLGVPVFEADVESKRLLDTDAAVKARVVDAFGESVYPHGHLDTKALARIVFNDRDALERLNAIAHPAVRMAFRQWAARQHAPYVLVEAALLVDTGWAAGLDHLVVVQAPEQLRVRRVMARDGADEQAVRARMRNQIDDTTRVAAAHDVVTNDDTRLVIPQVLAVHQRILAKAHP
jgi:dephospho-CoA kinase